MHNAPRSIRLDVFDNNQIKILASINQRETTWEIVTILKISQSTFEQQKKKTTTFEPDCLVFSKFNEQKQIDGPYHRMRFAT